MKKKVLLMGMSGVGKTSMRSVIFQNYPPHDTSNLGTTYNVEYAHVKFLGNLVLNIWDCGGQDLYQEAYVGTNNYSIFRDVAVLIFVFDLGRNSWDADIQYFRKCITALIEESPLAKLVCLMHKLDLVVDKDIIKSTKGATVRGVVKDIIGYQDFYTSIYDSTLFEAWSAIIHELIPNIAKLENAIEKFATLLGANEVLLMEKATFLVITQYPAVQTTTRYQRLSQDIKKFQMCCSKSATVLRNMWFRFDHINVVFEDFTNSTYLMVAFSDVNMQTAAVQDSIRLARLQFRMLENASELGSSMKRYPHAPVDACEDQDADRIPEGEEPPPGVHCSLESSGESSSESEEGTDTE